jgi:hypothetical protein
MIVATSPLITVTIDNTCNSGLKVVNKYVFMNFTVDDIKPGTTKLTYKIDDLLTAINYKPGCFLGGYEEWKVSKDIEKFEVKGKNWYKFTFDSLSLISPED